MTSDLPRPLTDHLAEIRTRLIKSIVLFIVVACVLFGFIAEIMPYVTKPVENIPHCRLISISVPEKFITHFTLACYLALFISSPFILYQIWGFVSVALTAQERRGILLYFPFSCLLFGAGAGFGYIVVLPLGLRFLLGFGSPAIEPMLSISKYISFVGMLTIAFGIIFQLPLAMVFMTRIGIVTPQTFTAKRKVVIVLIFIVAAILTPPDVITQILMAIPLMALYEVGIIFSRMIYRKKQAKIEEFDTKEEEGSETQDSN